MSGARPTLGILGAALAASLVLNVYLWHRLPTHRDASTDATAQHAPSADLSRHELPTATPRGPLPCPPGGGQASRGSTASAGGSDDVFDDEERDEVWAPQQEAVVIQRIREMLDSPEPEVIAECRSSCCRISEWPDSIVDFVDDLQSSAGFDFWAVRKAFHQEGIDLCFDRSGDTLLSQVPNRAVERQALLANAATALAACRRLVDAPFDLKLSLAIDTRGEVQQVHRDGELSGTDAALCAERAIVAAGAFAEAPFPTSLPVRVRLEPRAQGTDTK